jgi:H+/Cl- antiporter ClcA
MAVGADEYPPGPVEVAVQVGGLAGAAVLLFGLMAKNARATHLGAGAAAAMAAVYLVSRRSRTVASTT